MVKYKELVNLGKKEQEEKLKALKLELIKARVAAGKGGKTKLREIKKTIARLKTLHNAQTKKQ